MPLVHHPTSPGLRVPGRLAKPDQAISPQNASPPPQPIMPRWMKGLNFNLKIALNYFCADHLPEPRVRLSGKGVTAAGQRP